MKRDAALISLSRDHHRALSVAQRLRRATAETQAAVREDALSYWTAAGRPHFRLEEEVLLPAYAAYGDAHHPLVARALCEHVALRRRMHELAGDPSPQLALLHELGVMLDDHVRLEECELFVLIEQTLPADQLAAVGAALQHAQATSQDA